MPALVGAKIVKNAVQSAKNAQGGCITCGQPVKLTLKGHWVRDLPLPKRTKPDPVKLASQVGAALCV